MIKYLLISALVLSVLFYSLLFFNVHWAVVFYASYWFEAIISSILGFCLAILLYNNEDNDEKKR